MLAMEMHNININLDFGTGKIPIYEGRCASFAHRFTTGEPHLESSVVETLHYTSDHYQERQPAYENRQQSEFGHCRHMVSRHLSIYITNKDIIGRGKKYMHTCIRIYTYFGWSL